jgi:hypothetical protein
MNKSLPFIAAALLCSCAPGPKTSSSMAARPVDAVLSSGKNLFLFNFAQSRYQKWALEPCRVADTLKKEWHVSASWLALPAPSLPFTPTQAIWGPSGNFYLLDRTGKRLAQYDSNAQFLSSLPLPREIASRPVDRLEIFRDVDGVFSFLDLGEGLAWQFEEMSGSGGGAGDWRSVNRIRLPLGLEGCLWRPFSRDLCCTGSGSQEGAAQVTPLSAGVCFDKYFNSKGPWHNPAPGDAGISPDRSEPALPGIRAVLSEGEPGWILALDDYAACDSASAHPRGVATYACQYPDKSTLSACPDYAGAPADTSAPGRDKPSP